jgi:hypothetical protein
MKYKIIGFIIIFIIIGGAAVYFRRLDYYKKTRNNNGSATVTPIVSASPDISALPSPQFSPTPEISPAPTLSPGISPSPSTGPRTEKTLRIEVTETEAGLYESRAKKGALVHFTIAVVSESHSLEFKSGSLTTGQIEPGKSKTIDFVLEQTMVFTPYDLTAGKTAPYTIKIIAID